MFCASLFVAPAYADEDIPTYKILTCEKNCPNITPPVRIDTSEPTFPTHYMFTHMNDVPAEAFIKIRYTIGTDGTVTDARIEYLLGPQEFADRALATIKMRRFKSATENGKPVAVNRRVQFVFRVDDADTGARKTIVTDYQSAVLLADQGKIDEAISILKSVAAEPEQNFYERTMIAFELATLYSKVGNYEDALDQVRVATIVGGAFLDNRSQEHALRLRIELEAHEGQWAEAFAWFDFLKKHVSVPAEDEDAALIEKLHTLINAPDPIVLAAKIPYDADHIWQHTLLHRTFTFAQVQGKLDGFDLLCDAHGIESVVSDKAQWTVPKSWTGCMIYVTGEPGTSFRFAEASAPNG